jgi:hypothetical protein
MNVQLVAFAFGGVLLFVGVLGGGFEVKELKVPKVGAGVRILSAIVGVIFIVLGFSGSSASSQESVGPGGQRVVLANTNHDPVEFFLTDQLGDDEVSEQVTVLIDGKDVGDLTVNQNYPSSKIRVSVPQTGQHSYTAEATAVFDDQGTSFEYTGVGQGMINVQAGKIYSLRGSVSGNTWLVSIEEQ